jgi:hypothetical protein
VQEPPPCAEMVWTAAFLLDTLQRATGSVPTRRDARSVGFIGGWNLGVELHVVIPLDQR